MAKAMEKAPRRSSPRVAAGRKEVERLRARCAELEAENRRLDEQLSVTREELLDQLAPNRNSPEALRTAEAVRRRLAGPPIEVDPEALLAAEEPDV